MQIASVRIEGPGPTLTSGVGELPDKTRVVVENVVAADDNDKPEKASDPEARAKLQAYLAAKPEEREEKKLGEGLGSATKFWALFEKDRREYDAATGARSISCFGSSRARCCFARPEAHPWRGTRSTPSPTP